MTTAAGMPGLMLGGRGGSVGDAGPATIPLTPPAKLNLEACKSISDDLSSQSVGDCFVGCNQAGLVNSGFFEGRAAYAGATVSTVELVGRR